MTIHRDLDDVAGGSVLTERYTEEAASVGWGEVGEVQDPFGEPVIWQRVGQKIEEVEATQFFVAHQLLDGTSQTFIQFLANGCPFQLFGDFHWGLDELNVELHENQPEGNNNGFEFLLEKKYFDDGATAHQFLFKLFIPKILVKKILASIKTKEIETLAVTLDFSEIPGLYENAKDYRLKLLCAEDKVQGLESNTKTDSFDTKSEKSFFPGQIVSVKSFERQYSLKPT